MKPSGLTLTLRQLEKDVTNFGKTGAPRRTVNYLTGRLSMLEKTMETAEAHYTKELSALDDDDEQHQMAVEAIYDKIREGYFEYRSDLLDSIDKAQATRTVSGNSSYDSTQATSSTCRSSEIRLPKINIPVFVGNYETWRAFRDLFVSLIHNNATLSEIQKMHYLKTSVSGEAEKLLMHLSLDCGNYAKAWQILTDRYDHQRFLVNVHLKCLFNQPAISQEQAESVKQLLDTSTEVVHSLANLKVPVEHWDVLLIFVLLQKLPAKTQQLWEEKLSSKADSKTLPTFSEFTQFLETRFRTLEAVFHQQVRPIQTVAKSVSSRNVLHTSANTSKYSCQICSKGQHAVRKCDKFLKMSTGDRIGQVNKIGVCKNCLAYTHSTVQCPSNRRCYYCQQPHHSLLHLTNSSEGHTSRHSIPSLQIRAPSFQPAKGEKTTGTNVNTFYSTNISTRVLLATALVKVKTTTGQLLSLRALLDLGSEASFITTSAAHLLGLPLKSTSVGVSGLGLVSGGICSKVVDITFMSHHSAFKASIQALVLKTLSGHLPAQTLTIEGWEHLNGLTLADPHFNKSAKVELLLGGDVLADILLPELIRPSNDHLPIAQKTKLGWVIFGKAPIPHRVNSFLQVFNVETELRKFWEVEEVPFQPHERPEDIECEEHFTKTIQRLTDGRFQVALPFKGGVYPFLGKSREGAFRRLISLERKLDKDPQLKQRYADCLEDYLKLGHMEEVKEDAIVERQHYFLPHHAVFKEGSSTTKLRVVFDASFKTMDGISLNDQLMIGPALQLNITDIILRWRLYRYTYTADMEKMYRQIWVTKDDSQYQLILWRKQPSDILKVYRLKTVTFGTAPAPYLAIRTLQALAKQVKAHHPRTTKSIRSEMYVDDLISGAETVQEAQSKIKEIKKVLAAAGFHLRKWTANDKRILDDIPTEDHETFFCLPSESSQVKTLGIQWLPLSDEFCFKYNTQKTDHPTKRCILSSIARLFDPMGWIAPSITKAKLIMQLLWIRKQSWDDPVDADIVESWINFQDDLHAITNLRIPRWLHTTKTTKRLQLHGFCDSSERAYGAAVYLRVEDGDGITHMHLLMAKSRLAPVSPVTLPRLELCGAVQLAQLLSYISKTLEWRGIPTFAWTDSMITLCWIRADPTKWETFVRNRVGEIQRLTSVAIWNHVPTQANPADLISRGLLPSALVQSSLWWNGPNFLTTSWDFKFPEQPKEPNSYEGRSIVKVFRADANITQNAFTQLIDRSSSLAKVCRVTAYCQRFIGNIRRVNNHTSTPFTPTQLEKATMSLIWVAQGQMFPDGITKTRGMGSLNPFVDGDNIIRVGGRLSQANIPFNQQHPIILDPKYHITLLIIRDAHLKTLHGGIQLMMAHLRQKYWILQLKRAVKKFIHNCVICHRFRTQRSQQLMGELPAPRVTISRPFTHTGIDYAGPINIRAWKGRGAKCHKGYLAIFICLATKAIHLEAVSDLTSQSFLAAFRRFAARRGVCAQIYSDCGTNFVGADVVLRRLLRNGTHDYNEIANVLATEGTKWNFIPPASPHFGGLWEAGVKSVKFHLKRVVGNETLTYEELSTFLAQVEACLNSRPLCPLTEDPADFQALTPAHFLIGESLFTVPEADLTMGKQTLTDRWKNLQRHLQTFWKHWQTEYLSRLQHRPKWLKSQPQLMIGQLVLIKDERLPPAKWNLGRIVETYPGADNVVRVVKVKTQQSEFKRPIIKLCPLPTNEIEEARRSQICKRDPLKH